VTEVSRVRKGLEDSPDSPVLLDSPELRAGLESQDHRDLLAIEDLMGHPVLLDSLDGLVVSDLQELLVPRAVLVLLALRVHKVSSAQSEKLELLVMKASRDSLVGVALDIVKIDINVQMFYELLKNLLNHSL